MELNRQLADTIGAQVENLLGMGHNEADNQVIDAAIEAARRGLTPGQPGGGGSTPEQLGRNGLPVGQGGAPVTAQPVAPAGPSDGEIDWESTKAANGMYLGKYKTRAEAVKGVAHSVAMAKTAFTRVESVEAENARLREQLNETRRQPVVAPTIAPTQATPTSPSLGDAANAKLDEVLSKLGQGEALSGEDLVAFRRALSEAAFEAGRKAAREEREQFDSVAKKEQDRWARVEQYMAEKYPDSVNFGDELALFIKTHPLVGAGVKALTEQDRHEEAIAAAWEAFTAQQGAGLRPAPSAEDKQRELELEAADQARREALDIARRDAGIVGQGAGARGVHEGTNTGPSEDEYNRAVALSRHGNGAPLNRILFKDILSHPIFGD